MSTLKTINVIHPSGATTNIVNDASGNITVGNNITVTGASARFLGDFSNATISTRFAFQTSTTNGSTGIYALPNGSSTAASWQATNAADPTNASKILIATNGSTDVQLVSGINGTGTYLPLTFYNNGSEQARITTTGVFYFNSGYGSSAPVYGCRAWVNWTGSSGTIRGSGGVTSVTRNGTGDYTINFSFTMPDANYNATMMASKATTTSGSSNLMCIAENNVPTTTALRLYNNPSNSGASTADPVFACVAIFR